MSESSKTPLYDYIIKILIIGESGVGKSSVLLRFISDSFDERQIATIGVDFKEKYLVIDQKKIRLFIWDTAGQERFRTLTSSYYRGAHGVILAYDCTNRESFDHLKYWLQEVDTHCTNPDCVKLLIGNKIDSNKRVVSRLEGKRFAAENAMLFIETSAKECIGIQQTFHELVSKILEMPSLTNPSTGKCLQNPETDRYTKCLC